MNRRNLPLAALLPVCQHAARMSVRENQFSLKPFTAEDIRFTTKDGALYAIVLGVPDKELIIKSLGTVAKLLDKPVRGVTQLGGTEKVQWSQGAEALTIKSPQNKPPAMTLVFQVTS